MTAKPVPAAAVTFPPHQVWRIISVLLCAEIIVSLESSLLYPALPTVAREFGGIGRASLLMSVWLLVNACSAVVCGRLGDLYGRKRVMVIMLALCATGSLISALSEDFFWIIVGRGLQGAAGAILPLAFGLVRAILPAGRTSFYVGILAGGFAGSHAAGFVIGGMLAEAGFWRGAFWITAIAPLFVIPAILANLPRDEISPDRVRLDTLGIALLLPAIFSLMLSISEAGQHGWSSGRVLAMAVFGGALLATWIFHELRHPAPLVDLRLFKDRRIAVANTCNVLLSVSAMHLPLILMLFVQQPVWTGAGLGLGAALAGLITLPFSVVALIAGPISGLWGTRFGPRMPLMVGGVVSSAAWAWMAFANDQLWHIILGSVLAGFGISMLVATIPMIILEAVPKQRSSEATGLTIVIRGMTASIGAQLIGALLASSRVVGPQGSHYPTATAFQWVMIFVAVCSAVTVALAMILPKAQSARNNEFEIGNP